MKYLIITIILSIVTLGNHLSAQQQKGLIKRNFDSLVYYPDSTIQFAFHTRNGKLHGYAVEFDSLGEPKYIGPYKRGKRHGRWECFGLGYIDFRNGKDILSKSSHPSYSLIRCYHYGFYPYYHSGIRIRNFRELYESLLGFAPNDISHLKCIYLL